MLCEKLREVCIPVHTITGPRSIDLVKFHAPARASSSHGRNVVVFGDGRFDRSPCGTGTCARMALLHDSWIPGLDELFVHESIINTTFTGRLCGLADLGGINANEAQ